MPWQIKSAEPSTRFNTIHTSYAKAWAGFHEVINLAYAPYLVVY